MVKDCNFFVSPVNYSDSVSSECVSEWVGE